MNSPMPHPSCDLVEWYHPELGAEPLDHTDAALDDCAASMTTDGCRVQLLTMLA